jgi:hypothetical protein
MNLDHGTDFATTLNGVPMNLPSHAHGQGYTDLNLLIPELISHIDYRKGPYFASNGDFSSAGSAHIVYRTQLDRPLAGVTLGPWGYARHLAAGSREIADGVTLLGAVEHVNNNGPWRTPQGLEKFNTLLTLSGGSERENWSTSFSAYSARWQSTDQIPQRLIDAGSYQGQAFGRFDTLDPSDGAQTRRLSLSGQWRQSHDTHISQVQLYAMGYGLDLYSNFTYALQRPSDQFAQTDRRTVLGGQASRTWVAELGTDQFMLNTLGVQLRQDQIRLGLYDTVQRRSIATIRDDEVAQTALGIYGQNELRWNPWLRSIAGVRLDQLQAQVQSHTLSANSGLARAFQASPKLSFIFGPWRNTEFFLNAGHGFHSNDARGMTAQNDPRTGAQLERVPGLVRSRGQEIGLRTDGVKNWQSSLALWRLDFDSELVYVGDMGNTQAGRPSQRVGVEWSNRWTPARGFAMDANMAWSHPRYGDHDPAGPYIMNAPQKVAHVQMSWSHWGPWSASVGWRYIGSAALTTDNSVRSTASLLSHLKLTHTWSKDLTLNLDVLNLANRKSNDISYFYTSRVAGETAGVNDIHVHPQEPRSIRATALVLF